MLNKQYRYILFDCMNTLLLPDPENTPLISLEGRQVISTAAVLTDYLRRYDPALTVAGVHRTLREGWHWANERRGASHQEIPALQRFGQVFEMLNIPVESDGRLEQALLVHMQAVTASYYLPPEHRALLLALKHHYPIGLFSNFDCAPELRRLLERQGIAEWFSPLLISEEIGWRKPGKIGFDKALAQVPAEREDILFVGDSLEDDVLGALEAGVDIAWFNRRSVPAPSAVNPTRVLASLDELRGILKLD